MGETPVLVTFFKWNISTLSTNNSIPNSCRYKEGRVILEYALVTEAEGFQSEAATTSH